MGTAGRSDLVLPETASLSQQKSQIILCSSRDGRNSETPWGGYWALLGVLCNRLVCEEGVSAGVPATEYRNNVHSSQSETVIDWQDHCSN